MKLSFKRIIFFSISLLFIFTIYITLYSFYSYNERNINKKFEDENIYSTKVVLDYFEKEKKSLIKTSRVVLFDQRMRFALLRGVNFDFGDFELDRILKNNKFKIKKMNKIKYLDLIASLSRRINLWNAGGLRQYEIELYDGKLNYLGKSSGITKDLKSSKNDKFITDAYNKPERAWIRNSFFEIKNNKVILRGIERFLLTGSNSGFYGISVITKEIDTTYLYELGKVINKDIFFIKDNEVFLSSRFLKEKKLVGTKIQDSMYYNNFKIDKIDYSLNLIPIKNYNQENIFYIGIGDENYNIKRISEGIKRRFIYIGITMTAIIMLFLFILLNYIFNPFNKIVIGLNEIKKGNYNNDIIVNNKFELGDIANNINELKDTVNKREMMLTDSMHSMKFLLNNIEIGFLTIDKNYLVENEYSIECENIFEKEIKSKNILDLLFEERNQLSQNFEKSLEMLFQGNEDKNVVLKLLPTKLYNNNKILEIEYKFLKEQDKLLFIIKDITKTIKIKERIEKDQKKLRMVVKVFKEKDIFINEISEFKFFYKFRISEILKSTMNLSEMYFEIYRKIHTFKGNFDQLDLVNIGDYLHNFETFYTNFGKNLKTKTKGDLKKLLNKVDFEEFLYRDIQILEDALGIKFNKIQKYTNEMKDMFNKVEKNLMAGKNYLLEIIKAGKVEIKTLLSPYINHCYKLAKKLNKKIEDIEIIGGDILVYKEKYSEFAKVFNNLFRNILDHGIEFSETRVEKGKNSKGKIRIEIIENSDSIKFILSDDGSGLNYEKIREKIVLKNILTKDIVNKIKNDDLIEYIFMDNFSTKEIITSISGRGAGLPEVKKQVLELNGKISVYSEENKGTTFEIIIPERSINEIVNLSGDRILNKISYFFQENFEKIYNIKIDNIHDIEEVNEIKQFEFSSFISLKGIIDGELLISIENIVLKMIGNKIFGIGIDECDSYDIKKDIISEFANILSGNILDSFSEIKNYLTIGIPKISISKNLEIFYPGKELYFQEIEFFGGRIFIYYIK